MTSRGPFRPKTFYDSMINKETGGSCWKHTLRWLTNAERGTCGTSVQNFQCTKAGTAGGRNIQSEVNIWQLAVSVSHLQTCWSQPSSSQCDQGVLRHSSDMSQNRPDESWCRSDYLLFWQQRNLQWLTQLYALLRRTASSYILALFY